jgi:hypothetical protein
MSLPGASALDVANARAIVRTAAAKDARPVDPSSLRGRGAQAYLLLLQMGVAASEITIYQNDGGDFSAVLSAKGFEELANSKVQSHPGDVFLHYPYTDGERDYRKKNSLHAVWFDPSVTNYVGGSGVYMQFHTDEDNPWSGSMAKHLLCALFKSGCL